MAQVRFTRHLVQFFPTLKPCEIEASTVAGLVAALNHQHPGISQYILDETGRLRRHVNIFVGDEPIADRVGLTDRINSDSNVFILQALSGG